MKNQNVEYDKYYQTENLFGEPYPELTAFYAKIENKGKLLDLGCGQGRDAIVLARLGYEVIGVDYSKVGIEQLNKIANNEKLSLRGIVADIYEYSDFETFEFILLDSMFHFGKRERIKEIRLLNKIIEGSKVDTLITICIQNVGHKIDILHSIISEKENLGIVDKQTLIYKFKDENSGHTSKTEYEMITIKKIYKS